MVVLDLVPAQIDQLTDPQTMTIGHQDHGGVAVTVAVVLGLVDQTRDLGLGQIFARAQLGIRPPAANCSLFDGWSHQPGVLFRHGFLSLFTVNCVNNNPFTNSYEGLLGESK